MVENDRVCSDFRRILEQQPDVGYAKIISKWFFEPPIVFDPNSGTRLKPTVIIGLIYIALMAATCAAFNLK